jgi:hypothetical protein
VIYQHTTLDARMLADATEKLVAHVDNELSIDSFLDQRLHAREHGVSLTDLSRVILGERVQMKAAHVTPTIRFANRKTLDARLT